MAIRNALLSFAVISGIAANPISAHAIDEANELTTIGEQISLLNARKALLESQLGVRTAENSIEKLKGSDALPDLPTVKSIEGIDNKHIAILVYGHGLPQERKKGAKLHGGWSIVEINPEFVLLARGEKRVRLTVGNDAVEDIADVEARPRRKAPARAPAPRVSANGGGK